MGLFACVELLHSFIFGVYMMLGRAELFTLQEAKKGGETGVCLQMSKSSSPKSRVKNASSSCHSRRSVLLSLLFSVCVNLIFLFCKSISYTGSVSFLSP